MSTLGFPVIDADGHVEEIGVDWVRRVGEEWGDWAPIIPLYQDWVDGDPLWLVCGRLCPLK